MVEETMVIDVDPDTEAHRPTHDRPERQTR
jgi:hypothetical protein